MERLEARILVCLSLAACVVGGDVRAQDPFTLVSQATVNTAAPSGDAPVLTATGRPDLIALLHPGPGTVTPLLANGAGGVSPGPALSLGAVPTAAIAGDLDADGVSELIVISAAGTRIAIIERQADDTLRFRQQLFLPGVPTAVDAGDIDGDGSIDLALTLIDLGGFALAINDGAGALTLEPTITGVVTPSGIAIGDFDRDGNADLAVASELTDRVSVWLGEPGGVFPGESQSLTTGRRPRHLIAADLSRTARDDLVVTLNAAGSIERFDSDVDGSLASQGRLFVGQQPTRVRAADLDEDGRPDLAVSLGGETGYTVLRNTEAGLVAQTVETIDRTFDVAMPDLDADGRADVFATASTALRAFPALNRTPSRGPRCPGDANGDLFVDGNDFIALLVGFGLPASTAFDGADFDGSGFVDSADFVTLLVEFGNICGDN